MLEHMFWGFMFGMPVGFAVSEFGMWLWRTLPWTEVHTQTASPARSGN